MVEVFCDMCKRPGRALLGFLKPRGWVKHKTPDRLELLFCSMTCFRKFKGVKLTPRLVETKEHEVARPPMVEVPA